MSLNGAPPSVVVIGDLCIDDNEANGHILEPSWGSPALFIARQLRLEYGLHAQVSGPYGLDLLPLITEFERDREPSGERSLAYRNIVGGHKATQDRTQYWRPADRPLQPISPRATWQNCDLVYFCPLVPDEDRAADIAEFCAARLEGRSVQVLLAQGLMRTSGALAASSYRRVHRRDIDDAEAATWSCFDIVVFSDEDLQDAVAKATRWSAADAARNTGYVVTQGHRGATLCFQGAATPYPTRPAVTDATVGAGDVFAATLGLEFYSGFAAGALGRSDALHQAVVKATAAASRYVGAGSVATG
ncbi:hypothetical protein [Tessaracoccus sp. Z1128]